MFTLLQLSKPYEVWQLLYILSRMLVAAQQQFERMATNDGAPEKFQPETGKDQYSQKIYRGACLGFRELKNAEKREWKEEER